jgi:hypothetical protein
MAIGIIIMGLDFIYGFAAMQFEKSGTSSMMACSCLFISYHWGALYFASSCLLLLNYLL